MQCLGYSKAQPLIYLATVASMWAQNLVEVSYKMLIANFQIRTKEM